MTRGTDPGTISLGALRRDPQFVAHGHPGLGQVGVDVLCQLVREGPFTADGGPHREPSTRLPFVRRTADLGGHVIKGVNEAGSS